jgi:hypothetical protein
VKHETPEERARRLKNKRLSYQRRQLNKKWGEWIVKFSFKEHTIWSNKHRT